MIRQLACPLRVLLRTPGKSSWAIATSCSRDSMDQIAPGSESTASCSGRPAVMLWPARFQSTAAAAESILEDDAVLIDDTAVQRLKQLQLKTPDRPLMLRVEVQGGGCSGFQYIFKLEHDTTPDDMVFTRDGAKVVCDSVSLGFLKGAKIEFEDNLMRSAFQIAQNPNSEATCGCGSSFVAKM